jgi:hypothetical protein
VFKNLEGLKQQYSGGSATGTVSPVLQALLDCANNVTSSGRCNALDNVRVQRVVIISLGWKREPPDLLDLIL